MGMENGQRRTGNGESLKWESLKAGIFKNGKPLKAGIFKMRIFKKRESLKWGTFKSGNL